MSKYGNLGEGRLPLWSRGPPCRGTCWGRLQAAAVTCSCCWQVLVWGEAPVILDTTLIRGSLRPSGEELD